MSVVILDFPAGRCPYDDCSYDGIQHHHAIPDAEVIASPAVPPEGRLTGTKEWAAIVDVAVAQERARIRSAVEALPQQTVHADPFFPETYDYQTVGRAQVLAAIEDGAT